MTRGWARCLLRLALVAVAALPSLGCDALTVRPFAGTVSELTLAGAQVTPPGQHIEIWARDRYNDIIRLNPFYDQSNGLTANGLMVRAAIPLDSPCIIDGQGNLLTSAAAYPTSTNNGVVQTPDEQAAAVLDRMKQLNPAAPGPLLAIVPWDDTPEPVIAANATPAARLATCNAFKSIPNHPNTYVPNPLQVTAPAHGVVYGFVSFSTLSPPTNYDGYRLDMPVSLKGVQEIFFTTEGSTVDPKHRGPLYLVSTLTPAGNGVVHFDLTPPAGSMSTVSGTAALYVNLDQGPAANEF